MHEHCMSVHILSNTCKPTYRCMYVCKYIKKCASTGCYIIFKFRIFYILPVRVCVCVWERSVSCSVATHVVAYKHTHTPTHMQFCCALHVRTHLCVYTLLNLICLHLCIYVNETIFTFLHRMHIYICVHVVHLYTQCNHSTQTSQKYALLAK